MEKLSTWVIIAENPYADIDMLEVPSEVPVGSGENISESICISRGKIVRVTIVLHIQCGLVYYHNCVIPSFTGQQVYNK